MLRSKKIGDYIEAKLEDLRPGTKIPVDLHLHFSANRHILLWRKRDEKLSDKFIAKYRKRGMKKLWIHRDDEELWRKYLSDGPATEPGVPAEEPAAAPASGQPEPAELAVVRSPMDLEGEHIVLMEAPVPQTRTQEGREILEILNNAELNDRQRKAMAAKAARELLAETLKPAEPEKREEAMAKARDTVRDILDNVLDNAAAEVRATLTDVWDLTALDPELNHGINVASFAVLFAMAFGRISQDVLGDIALAGLLHDIGLTQIPAHVVQVPWTQQSARERQIYSRHVDEGLRLIDEYAGPLSPRIRPMIQQHHEKFDGTGYPMQLQGFQVNDIAQLVAMADTLESMASGQWDGVASSLIETFNRIEKLERGRSFPEYFNPEVFAAVTRWIRDPGATNHKDKASDIVRTTTRDLMKRKA
jgi:HD-GYP domain-containing protein (c-di-GMP phosphodiesterase class II)